MIPAPMTTILSGTAFSDNAPVDDNTFSSSIWRSNTKLLYYLRKHKDRSHLTTTMQTFYIARNWLHVKCKQSLMDSVLEVPGLSGHVFQGRHESDDCFSFTAKRFSDKSRFCPLYSSSFARFISRPNSSIWRTALQDIFQRRHCDNKTYINPRERRNFRSSCNKDVFGFDSFDGSVLFCDVNLIGVCYTAVPVCSRYLGGGKHECTNNHMFFPKNDVFSSI